MDDPPVKRRKWQCRDKDKSLFISDKTLQILPPVRTQIKIEECVDQENANPNVRPRIFSLSPTARKADAEAPKTLKVPSPFKGQHISKPVDSDVENEVDDATFTIGTKTINVLSQDATITLPPKPKTSGTELNVPDSVNINSTYTVARALSVPVESTPCQPASKPTRVSGYNTPTFQNQISAPPISPHSPPRRSNVPGTSTEDDLLGISFMSGLQAPFQSCSMMISPRKFPWNERNLPRSSSPKRLESQANTLRRRRHNSRNKQPHLLRSHLLGEVNIAKPSAPPKVSTAQKRERRAEIHRRYSIMPTVKAKEPTVVYQEQYTIDPYDPDHKEASYKYVEKNVISWLHQVLAPVMWEKAVKGKKTLAKLRLEFREFYVEEVKPSMDMVYSEIDAKKFILRERKDLKDVGKLTRLAAFFVDCINPMWLVLCAEAIINGISQVRAFEDTLYRRKMLKTQFFIKEGSTLLQAQRPGSDRSAERWFLRRCFELFKFLDLAKTARLIDEDPPIFNPQCKLAAGSKSILNLLTEWSTKWLGKEGSIKKHLSRLNYNVEYTQRTIDEIDVHITNLGSDLQNGVRMAKLLETCNDKVDVMDKLRFNPGAKSDIPRMSREHNWKLVLKVFRILEVDLSFNYKDQPGELSGPSLALGHREQTLVLCVRLMRHFHETFKIPSEDVLRKLEALLKLFLLESPSMKMQALMELKMVRMNATIVIQRWYRNMKIQRYIVRMDEIKTIQKWWRSIRLRREIERRVWITKEKKRLEKMDGATQTVQRAWRCYMARQKLVSLRNQKLAKSAICLQSWYRGLAIRRDYLRKRDAALKIQTYTRRFLAQRLAVSLREARRNRAACLIQANFRRVQCQRQYKSNLSKIILVQTEVRGFLARKRVERIREERANGAATLVQSTWRGFVARRRFILMKNSALRIQSVWRGTQARVWYTKALEARKNKAATTLQAFWRGARLRREFLERRRKVVLLQSLVRRRIAQREVEVLRQRLEEEKRNKAALTIQCAFRRYRAQTAYLQQRRAAISIQKQFRTFIFRRSINLGLHRRHASVIIQKLWRGRMTRRATAQLMVTISEARERRERELKEATAATMIQKVWRGHSVRKTISDRVWESRVSLLSPKPEDAPSLQQVTTFNLHLLADFATTVELRAALTHLIDSVNLLPTVQGQAIVDGGGIESMRHFLTISTQTPEHIKIVELCSDLTRVIFKYIRPANKDSALDVIIFNLGVITRDKFAYKQVENTYCLLAALRLHAVAVTYDWVVSELDKSTTVTNRKKLADLKKSVKNMIDNKVKYKSKQLWLTNSRALWRYLKDTVF